MNVQLLCYNPVLNSLWSSPWSSRISSPRRENGLLPIQKEEIQHGVEKKFNVRVEMEREGKTGERGGERERERCRERDRDLLHLLASLRVHLVFISSDAASMAASILSSFYLFCR